MNPETPNRAAPGALLGGRYRLERVIGTGGMAAVWLAQDESLDRPVAIKIVAEALAHDESYLERFRREARIAAGVNHPNLVAVFDFEASEDRPYLVMEYVEGDTLAAVLELEAERVEPQRVAGELLRALRRIHEAGIVHRDVKPQNILVGDDGRTRLTDFGIARPEDATQLTSTGQVLGTLRYLAPEVRMGEPATERSDLYSAGIVLRECLGPGATGALADLAARMIEADPELRPPSADVALSEIEDTGRMPADPPTNAPEPATRVLARETAEGAAEPAAEPLPPPPPPATPRRTLGSRLASLTGRQILAAAIAAIALLLAGAALLVGDDGRPALTPDRPGPAQPERPGERPLIPPGPEE